MMKKRIVCTERKIKVGIAIGLCLWYSITVNKNYNNISKKLDMIMSNQEMIWLNTNELKIDSLQQEIMDIGWKLDSMTLKYEHGWEFTN